jgi:WD40 repeat protein
MTRHSSSSAGNGSAADLPTEARNRLEQILNRFEQAHRRGEGPILQEYLAAVSSAERLSLLIELAHADLEYRLKAGEAVRIEAYLGSYPELAEQAGVVLDLVQVEYALRRRREPELGLDEYLHRFPQHGDALRARLLALADSEQAVFPAPAGASMVEMRHLAAGQIQVGEDEPRTLPPLTAVDIECPHPAPTGLFVSGADPGDVPGLPVIPGYEIVAELGRGGMGVVYQARQIALNRLVALKMILAGSYAAPPELARFRAEAEAVARLQHPNIVQIHEVGEWRAAAGSPSTPFFSLEFVDGGSLEQKLRGTPLPALQSAALVETLAQAVHAAHERGIVHRDLKPANVLLARCDRRQGIPVGSDPGAEAAHYEPKITDFGLAKRLDVEAGPTQTGAILGTPSYMAPEQAGSNGQLVGPAADVYALGAILYELLTGRPPFRAATPLDTVLQVLSEEPVPPGRLRPKLPRDLQTICLKCLEKEPPKRYVSAAALADDLRRFQIGEAILARPAGAAERTLKWARRRPAVAGLLLAVLLSAIGLLVGGVWFTAKLQDERDLARREQKEADRQRHLAEQAQTEAAGKAAAEVKARQEAVQARRRAEAAQYATTLGLAERAFLENNLGWTEDLLNGCQRDLRNWEHRYLRNACQHRMRTFTGHAHAVWSVCFSPDGQRLASADWDPSHSNQPGEVKVWEVTSGQAILTLRGHAGGITNVCYSPDGRQVASASTDGTVRVWDATAGRETYTLKGHTDAVWCVCYSPDGQRLVSGGKDRTVKVWDAATGRATLSLQGHGLEVWNVCFSPDGRRLASSSGDMDTPSRPGEVKLWDLATGRPTHSLQGHTGGVTSIAFSPDSRRLASASLGDPEGSGRPGEVKVWDAASGQETVVFKRHIKWVWAVCFSQDGRQLASASNDGTIKIWDAVTGQEVLTLKGHTSGVTCLCFSPDGRRLASASKDRSVKVWAIDAGPEPFGLPGQTAFAVRVCPSPDGRRLALAGRSPLVTLWDALSGQRILCLKGHTGGVFDVCFSPDGRRLASASADRTVKIWDATTGTNAVTLRGHTTGVRCVSFSPDGWLVASAGEDSTIKVWDASTGREILTLKGHAGGITCLAFSPDGARLASSSADKTVKTWDLGTGRELRTFLGHAAMVTCVCFSPDGTRLVSASGGEPDNPSQPGEIRIWDVTNGKETLALKRHADVVTTVCFSPDGKRLASGSADPQTPDKPGEVKVWDAVTGHELLTLKVHTVGVWCVRFSSDGQRLISASGDPVNPSRPGEVKIWEANSPSPALLRKREAVRLVESLFGQHVRKPNVLAQLQGDRKLDEPLRQEALALAACYVYDPEQLNVSSWAVVHRPGAAASAYSRALLQAEEACRQDPGNGDYLNTLGVAQFRAGRYQEAVDTLTRSDRLNAARVGNSIPGDLAFLAMAHHRLGHKEQAQTALDHLRATMKKPYWAQEAEAQAFLRETEAFLADAARGSPK